MFSEMKSCLEKGGAFMTSEDRVFITRKKMFELYDHVKGKVKLPSLGESNFPHPIVG